MSDCSRGTVYGPSRDHAHGRMYLRVDCKKLSCERCGPKKARQYLKAIGREAEARRLNRMMTLTLDPKRCAAEDSVAYLRQCFAKFRVALFRRFGKPISFIAVVELQKSGMAHLHVLISVYIEQAWISQAWHSVGGGSIVDIRLVDVHRVNAYLAKYLTKDFFLSVPAKKKRVSTSRDIHLFEKKTERSDWQWSRNSIASHFRRVQWTGIWIIQDAVEDDAGLRSFVALDCAFERLP
jgi:hypothetical protein